MSEPVTDRFLNLYYGSQSVGRLSANAGSTQFDFAYESAWQRSGFALSPHLPLTGDFTSEEVTCFFQNLLPEGLNLEEIVRALRLSKTEKFELLKQIGADATGAFILAPDLEPANQMSDRPLPLTELSERLQLRERRNFAVWDQKVRVSVAGFQDKIGVKVVNNHWFLPDGLNNHTSHILKPPPVHSQFESMVVNEAFCMQLSQKVGLATAETEIVTVPEPVLLVTRFDRMWQNNGLYAKRHVIDGCQLLGLPPNHKMERPYGATGDVANIRDGASIAQLAGAIRRFSSAPILDIKAFIEWVAFQLCIGNVDAHAKNLSFFVDKKSKIRLTPFYDQVCILDFGQMKERLSLGDTRLDTALSMAIGDEFDLKQIGAYDIALMADEADLPIKAVVSGFERVAKAVLQQLDQVDVVDHYQRFDSIKQIINELAERLLAVLPDVAQAWRDLQA